MNALIASIQVRRGNESLGIHRMQDGTSLIIGNDENCGLSLEHNAIAAKHCVLRMADGDLFINDWYSDSGTFVNGEKIYAETQLDLRDHVTVGEFELRFDVTSSIQVDDASFEHTFRTDCQKNSEGDTGVVAHANEHLDEVERMVEVVRSQETGEPQYVESQVSSQQETVHNGNARIRNWATRRRPARDLLLLHFCAVFTDSWLRIMKASVTPFRARRCQPMLQPLATLKNGCP